MIFDEVKITLSGLLLKRVTSNLFLNIMSDIQREHFVKGLVQGIANNEDGRIRENLSRAINILVVSKPY